MRQILTRNKEIKQLQDIVEQRDKEKAKKMDNYAKLVKQMH